jgi:hypothetical protein
MNCPECKKLLDTNGLIAWCENGHVYTLESAEYPCEEQAEDGEER